MGRRETVEGWITQIGRVAGLGLVVVDGVLFAVSRGEVFEPLMIYAGLVLFGLGDVVGGFLGAILDRKFVK